MLFETATCKFNIIEARYVELTQKATHHKETILLKDLIGLIKNRQEKRNEANSVRKWQKNSFSIAHII